MVFTMHLGLFKLTVMYFGLTNLPTTFQAIMNDLFRDLINKRDALLMIY